MTEQEVLTKAREFVAENFLYMRKNKELADTDSLLRTGVISSLGMMELVGWVEETFGLVVDPSEITEQNFDSLDRLARFVTARQGIAAV